MSLIFVDGFDHYVTADLLKKWTAVSGLPCTISATQGRRGGGALSQGYGGYGMYKSLAANASTLIVGYAVNNTSGTFTAIPMCQMLDAGTPQVSFNVNADGSISALRNNTLLGTSAPGVLTCNGYQYVEFKATIHATTGVAVVRVNGAVVLNLTSQNTKATANAYAGSLYISAHGNNSYLDDLYVCDGNGSVNNTFLGDMRVDTIFPTSDGNYTGMTCSTGTSHFALVDEAAPNTTDYVSSSTVPTKDTYGMSDIATLSGSTIAGVQINNAALKDDAGARSIANLCRSSGTDAQSATVALSTSQAFYSSIQELNPSGFVAWTTATVNAAEFGVVVAA